MSSKSFIEVFTVKYVPCKPTDPKVNYFTTEDLREILDEVNPGYYYSNEAITTQLKAAGFGHYDIGSSVPVLKWCMKLKKSGK